MDVKKIMELSFFAKRIRVNDRRLSWCIIQTKNRDCERNAFPAISIKHAALYYDFLKDNLDYIVNSGGMQTIVEEARMTETPGGFRFETKGGEIIEISSEEITEFYKNKIYSDELNRAAKRFA